MRVEWTEGVLGTKDVCRRARHPGGPTFLRDTRVERMVALAPPEEEGEGEDSEDEESGEDGGPGPP